MPILEDENRTLRRRVHELELALRQIKDSQAQLFEENKRLKRRVLSLSARKTTGRSDKRIFARMPVTLRIDGMNSRGESSMGMARNVSLGGAFIETDLRLRTGESMTVAFELHGKPFKLLAEVIRVASKGFGVRFSMDAQQQERLKQYLLQL